MTNILLKPDERASQIMSLGDFLDYDDGTDACYELEDGRLLSMPSESEINRRIAMFLVAYFLQLGDSLFSVDHEDRSGGEWFASNSAGPRFNRPEIRVSASNERCQSFHGNFGYATAPVSGGNSQPRTGKSRARLSLQAIPVPSEGYCGVLDC